MKDLVRVVSELVASHPAVRHVELAGSRSRGTHEELSDWDFGVTTSDFEYVARDLPTLVAPLRPLGEQWEPMGHFPVFQVLLRGPTKIEYLFLDHSQEPLPAPEPGPETLAAIDMHFWDWIWWIATKAFVGRDNLVAQHLSQLSEHLLRPMGVTNPPGGIDAAITTFVDRRDQVERKYGVKVPRALEDEVRRGRPPPRSFDLAARRRSSWMQRFVTRPQGRRAWAREGVGRWRTGASARLAQSRRSAPVVSVRRAGVSE